jgi:hypothetical protein
MSTKDSPSLVIPFAVDVAPMKNYAGVPVAQRTPSFKQAHLFLDTLFPGCSHTFQTFDDLKGKRKDSSPCVPVILHGTLTDHQNRLWRQNSQGMCVSFAVNQTDGLGRKAKNIVKVRCLVVDLDGAPLSNRKKFPFKPHAIMESSPERYHLYYLVKKFPREKFKAAQLALASLMGGDPQVSDLPKALRLVGFFHQKDAEKIYRSRLRYLRQGPAYTWEEIEKVLPLTEPNPPESPLTPKANIYPDGTRNLSLYKRGCKALATGVRPSELLAWLQRVNQCHCAPPLELPEIEHVLKNVLKTVVGKGTRKDLPAFAWTPERLEEALQLVRGELLRSPGKCIYQVNDKLAIVRQRKKKITIQSVDPAYLHRRITRAINFYRAGEKPKLMDAPDKLVKSYASPTTNWRHPPLNGIITCPTLRPDGSLLDTPGYDKATGLLYLPDNPPPADRWVEDYPSRKEALDRIFHLNWLIKDFPFKQPYHHSVALAEMITAVIRPAMDFAPAFVNRGGKYGLGKTLLAQLVAIIATGQASVRTIERRGEVELKKALLPALGGPHSVIIFDNIDWEVSSPSLCSVLTSTEYTDRFLGESRDVTVLTNRTFIFTGKNISLTGGLEGRGLLCVLDSPVSNPDQRKFKLNIRKYVQDHRLELVYDILTIVRAYLAAGCPGLEKLSAFREYDQWNRFVRGVLIWLGLPDPCDSLEEIRNLSSETQETQQFLMAWKKSNLPANAVAQQLVTGADKPGNELLQEALEIVAVDRQGKVTAKALGEWLNRQVDCGGPLTHPITHISKK